MQDIAIVFTILLSVFIIQTLSANAQYNYDHVNVTTIVNVTNAYPEIISIVINGGSPFIQNAGGTKTLECNASIRDFNGFNDISIVNATLYHFYNTSDQADDANEHYTNASCEEIQNDGEYLANYTCKFEVQYFANNGTWNCNVSVNDSYNFISSDNETQEFDVLYALNVTDVIDYGNLSVGDTSENITAVITNFGNTDINVSVLGYGQTEGDGLAVVCAQGDNISLPNQRYSTTPVEWSSKTIITGTDEDLLVTLLQQTDDITPVTQNTYWQLFIPPNPFGVCTGVVRFTAKAPAIII